VPAPAFTCGATRPVVSFDGPIVAADFDRAGPDAYATMAVVTDAGLDQLTVDGFFNFPGSLHQVPGINDLDGGDGTGARLTYRQCGACATFYERCPRPGDTTACGRKYFAMSGRLDFQQVSQSKPGTMVAAVSGVTFVEWDFTIDAPTADAGCVLIRTALFDAGWP
jgi:hypothetical protein